MTTETLTIEAHPKGGFTIVARAVDMGHMSTRIAAFTTLSEALNFIASLVTSSKGFGL